MPYKVTDATWLSTESARTREIVLMPRYWGVEWTEGRLHKATNDMGLRYSREQIDLLLAELVRQGVIEEIA